MPDPLLEKHSLSSLSRRAVTLAVVTAGAAVAAATLIVVAAAMNWEHTWPIAIAGLAVVAILAITTVDAQLRCARAALAFEAKNKSLIAAHEDAATADHARARFVADVSHGLRQPLHALGLFLDALERRVTPGEGEKILAKTKAASSLLSRGFNALIDWTRVEADTLIPEVELFPVDGLLSRLDDEWSAVSSSAGLDLRVVRSKASIVADERLLSHVLRTLLSNAVDWAPGRLLLGVRHRSGRISIELHCSSEGRDIEKWALLNAPDATHPERGGADDLDLLVVRRLADLMGLTLRFVGKAGRGFFVALDLPNPQRANETPLVGRAVLLVAGDAQARIADAAVLAQAGAVVHVARNMRQADHVARSSRIDLLVTDVAPDNEMIMDQRTRIAMSVPDLPNGIAAANMVAAATAKLSP